MATTGYNKKGRPTWDLSPGEEKRFSKMQAERIINDESVIRSLFDDTQRKQKSITDALSVDGWTDSKSRVNLQKDIYSYQNNLAKLKSYGYDTTYQSEFGKTADKIAGARSLYYSKFKTKGDYDNYEIGERLKKNLKGATYEDIQNQITETQDTINRLRHNGSSSKLLTENARKLNILENWTNYESTAEFQKAIDAVTKKIENNNSEIDKRIGAKRMSYITNAEKPGPAGINPQSDEVVDGLRKTNNILKTYQTQLEKNKNDLEFSNKAQEYAKRLSGDEVRAIREYNNLYDKGVNNTLSLVAQAISSGGTSDNGAVDNGLTVKENNRKIEIENYFKNRGIDLKTVSDIYRSEDNKKLQEINLERIKSDMDSSKLATAIYTLSNPFVSATGGIPAVVGNIIYGDDVKYNPYNIINKASEVITQGFNDSVNEYLLKNKNLTLAPGMLNKKGEFLKSLIGGAYDLYNTMAESAIMRIPATVTGMPFLTDALFGINAFSSTYNDMIDSGADKEKALATSALAGVFEGLFEHVSLEKLKSFQTSASVTAKDFLKNSLKQFVTEGSEELFTDFANTISDQLINGDASELNRRMQDLVASGSTYNEALTQVAKEYAAQEVDTFVIGGLSGAVSGAGYTGIAAINNAETGRNINKSGQRSTLLSDAGQLADTSYDSALRAAYESVSRDEEKSRKGLGANLRTGNLYNLSRNQAYDNAVGAQKENVKKSVNNILVSIGTDERKADILSDSLSKIATGEKLTKTESQLVKALRNTANTITNLNEEGKKTYGEIVNGDVGEMTTDGIAARFVKSAGLSVKQAQNLAENIKSGNDRLALNFEYVAQMYNEGTAVDEASRIKSEKAYDTLERLDKYALGMSAKSAVVARSDEKNAKPAEIKKITNIDKNNGVMTVELSDGKDAQVSLTENNNGDVEFSNKKDEYIYTAAGTLFNTTEDANSFILASKNTDLPATDFVHEFDVVVGNAKAGEKIGNTKLPNEIAEMAYEIGLNSGKGAYRTFESGTSIKGNKNMSKLDVNNLSYGVTNMSTTRGGQSKTDMEVINRTLDAYGRKNNIKYVFVDSIKSPNGKNASGTYSAEDNVVYLSVNSKNPLSVAAGHETFHYMKRNNSKAGRELQEHIINKLKADKSYDYDARVKELSELYGTDDADAINEEIAANSMFDIFDEATVKDLAKNHRKLFDIVKEKLGEMLEYFKNAVKKYADFLGNKEARSNLRNDYEALQTIRDRMDKALEEIKNGESEKKESDEDKKEKEKKFAEKFSLDENEDIVNKYNQVLAENKHLRELNTILREEMRKTPKDKIGKKGEKILTDIAKSLIRKYKSSADSADISKRLIDIYDWSARQKISIEETTKAVAVVAEDIIKNSAVRIDEDDLAPIRKDLRAYLRETPIRLTDETKEFLAEEYGSYEKFRRKYLSRIRLTNDIDAPTLDTLWSEITSTYKGLFYAEDIEEDSFHQPLALAAAIENPPAMYLGDIGAADLESVSVDIATEIVKQYADKSQTYADKTAKYIDGVYKKYKQKFEDDRAKLAGMIYESRDIRYDLEQRRYFRAQTRKNVRAMSEKLLNPTKNKFIPAELRAPVAEFLKEFTYDALMFKNDDLDSLQRRYDAVIADNARTSFSIDDAYITDAIAQIRDLTAKLNETFGNDKRNFRKIGWSKMKAINEFVKALSHLVNNYNTVTIGGRHVDMYQTAYDMTKDLPKSRKQIALFSKLSDTYDRMIKYGNMTPYYFFKRMGGTMETLYKDLYDGEMSAAKEALSAKQKLDGIYKAYNAEDWINNKTRRDYTTERGEKFQLTTDQRLYLYAAVRTMIEDQRMQENGEVSPIAKYDVEIPHIMQGGIVFRDDVWKERKQVGDKLKIKATFEYKDSTPIRLTESDISAIFDDMPNEQKKFVDEIVKYMSGDLAKLGNETSVRLYGYEKFTKGYYFPIRSAQYYVRRADNSEQGQERSTSPLIKNKGMTKERREGANNPVVVENFTDVMSSHITDMINFRYLAEPQFNMFRVMNYNAKAIEPAPAESETQDEKTDSAAFENPREAVNVRTSLDNAYGHETTRYIDNLIHDISSGVTLDEVESVTAKALTGFKKLATAANLSVVVQQPTAIMRAMALVDPKYFVNRMSWNKSYDEAMKYSGTAILKDIGGFDMGENRSMASWLTDFDTGVKDKIKAFSPVEVTKDDKGEKNVRMSWNDDKNKSTRDDVFASGAKKADAVTWGLIWEAVKNETRAKSNLKGEALLEEAGRRFDEVIEATQVYDSVLSRSQFMRAKSTIGKTVTAFMAEPTKTFNMLMDANYERWVKKSKGSFKYLGRATGAILASNLLNAFIRSLVTALRRDPDKSYLEQYTKEVIENFADGISIINMLPIIKDIVSVMQGEDLTRSDFEPLADMYDAVTGAFKDKADIWDKANGVLVPAGVLTGIPLRNISRDLKALLNVFNYTDKKTTSAGLKFAVNEALNDIISKKTLNIFDGAFANDDYDKFFKYYDKGDTTKAEQKYDEIKAYLMWSGKTEDEAENAIESKIKSHILEKYPEIVEAVSAHVNGNVGVYTDKMNSVLEKYDAELVKAVEKSVESKLKRASTAKADNDTDSFNKLIDELTGYGYDKDTLERDIDKVKSYSSSSSDGYNGIYNKTDAVRAYVSGNMTLYNQIKDEMELDEGKIKTALNELYLAGEVTDEQYTDMYIAVLAPGKTTKTVTDVNEAKRNEAFFALEAQQAKKDGEEYSKYTDINTAMEDFVSGKEAGLKVFNAEVKKLEEHGVNKSTIKGNITTQYKDKVRELYKTNRSEYVNLRAKIVAMCGQLGYSTKESVKYLDNWVKDLK